LRAGGLSFAIAAYPTLAAIGADARPALPLLMDKARGIGLSYTGESRNAIATLGALAQFDRRRIVPLLLDLLHDPARAPAAAEALAKLGRQGTAVEDAVTHALDLEVNAGDASAVHDVEAALIKIGDPKRTAATMMPLLNRPQFSFDTGFLIRNLGPPAIAAIPALSARFHAADTNDQERFYDLLAMLAIAPRSPVVIQAYLQGLSRHTVDTTINLNLDVLRVRPFPAQLAPDLVHVLETATQDKPALRQTLEEALDHTGTNLRPVYRDARSPEDVGQHLSEGIWALAQQPHAISSEDVLRALKLDPDAYVVEHTGRAAHLWRKPDWSNKPGTPPLVREVEVDGIQEVLGSFGQGIHIDLSDGYCMTDDQLKPRFAMKEEPVPPGIATVTVSGSRINRSAEPPLTLDGDHSLDKSRARSTTVFLNGQCQRRISIGKSFDAGYANAICPFTYNKAFLQQTVMPRLRETLGNDFRQFALNAPKIDFLGWFVQLTYTEVAPIPTPIHWGWQQRQVSVMLDRCKARPDVVAEFIP